MHLISTFKTHKSATDVPILIIGVPKYFWFFCALSREINCETLICGILEKNSYMPTICNIIVKTQGTTSHSGNMGSPKNKKLLVFLLLKVTAT